MVIILGLGNPGPRYLLTRHNIGFRVIDRLAEELKIPLYKAGYHSFFGKGQCGGHGLILAKPMTYMNNSGLAAAALCRAFGVPVSGLLVVHDDLDLPEGRLRLRARGGSGGHNGISSIIYHLGSEDFPRLRIGIGRPENGDVVQFVLEDFDKGSLSTQEEALQSAVTACLAFLDGGIVPAMNRFNRKTGNE